MKSENTKFEDERTRLDSSSPEKEETGTKASVEKEPDVPEKKKSRKWGHAASGAAGVAGGIALGSAIPFIAEAAPVADGEAEDTAGQEDGGTPLADAHIETAQGVSDDMSFGEAFSTARAEVGSGGAFEWHGRIYSTFYTEEWNEMSDAERSEFESHFNFGEADEPGKADAASVEAADDDAGADADEITSYTSEENGVDGDAAGEPEVLVVDVDGDGVPDVAVVGDGDGEAEPDITLVDTDGDGLPDAVIVGGEAGEAEPGISFADTDGDGVPDALIVDNGGGGAEPEIPFADADGDGVPDAVDADGTSDSGESDISGHADPAGDLLAMNDADESLFMDDADAQDYVNDADVDAYIGNDAGAHDSFA